MIIKLNMNEFNLYYEDILKLLNEFNNDDKILNNLMSDIEMYLKNNQAIIAGHVINGELSSFIWSHERFYSNEHRLHIAYFVVNENHRGKGFSRELLNFITKEAKKLNIFKIDLNVSPSNHISISVYNNFGFETEKYLMSKSIEGEDV